MAFQKDKWAIDGSHANLNIPRTHRYKTDDAAGVVSGAGYFNAVFAEVEVGDTIDAVIAGEVTRYTVAAKSAGVVTVEDESSE